MPKVTQRGQQVAARHPSCSFDVGTFSGHGLVLGCVPAAPRASQGGAQAEGQTVCACVVSPSTGEVRQEQFPPGEEEACDSGLEEQVRCQQNILGMEARGKQSVGIQNSPPLPPTYIKPELALNLTLILASVQCCWALGEPLECRLP